MLKLITATALALVILAKVMPTQVMADTAEQSQDLDQKIEFECTASGYGQNTCKVLGKQTGSQTQKITFRKNVKPVEKLASTGIDTPVMAVGALTIAAGVTAAFIKSKLNA